MFESVDPIPLARNLLVYAIGVGLAVAGALGVVEAIGLSVWIAWAFLVAGLAVVLYVHEYLGGPV